MVTWVISYIVCVVEGGHAVLPLWYMSLFVDCRSICGTFMSNASSRVHIRIMFAHCLFANDLMAADCVPITKSAGCIRPGSATTPQEGLAGAVVT